MPLSEKARIEVYIPALPQQTYQNLLDPLAQEFTYTFGGSTIIRGLDGSYLSRLGVRMQDRVHLIYTDTPFAFAENFANISQVHRCLARGSFRGIDRGGDSGRCTPSVPCRMSSSVARMALWNRPDEALEATGHSARFLAGVGLYRVVRASAWALGRQPKKGSN